jgi:uncharacterized protein YggE
MTKPLLALLALAACHDTKVVMPQSVPTPGQMTVTGTATLEVSPDCADLTMTLSSDDAKPGVATQHVQSEENDLVAALHKLGVENGDLKLSYLTLEPVYDASWPHIRTYRSQITVTATTHDFARIAPIMEAGATAGATQMSSAFRRSDLPELKKKVREMALAAARDKAQQTASALGIKLGRISSVAEATGGAMWQNAYFPQANFVRSQATSEETVGGALQPLTLDVTIGYELARET